MIVLSDKISRINEASSSGNAIAICEDCLISNLENLDIRRYHSEWSFYLTKFSEPTKLRRILLEEYLLSVKSVSP